MKDYDDEIDFARCYNRKCKHFRGIGGANETEETEVNVCAAFPEGIRQYKPT